MSDDQSTPRSTEERLDVLEEMVERLVGQVGELLVLVTQVVNATTSAAPSTGPGPRLRSVPQDSEPK